MFSFKRNQFLTAALALSLAACNRNPDLAKRELLLEGKHYAQQGKYDDAIIEFKKAALLDPRYGEAYFELGQAYAAAHNLRLALPAYTRAADLQPDNVDANLKAGNLLLLAHHFQDAKTRARGILVKDPKNVRALVLLGNALAGLQNIDDAVNVAREAATINPERAGLETNLGVLELAKGDPAQAEAAFKKAVEVDPKASRPLLALASFYQNAGRLQEAETTLRRALALEPRNAYANQTLGTLLIGTNRPFDAEPYLKTATHVLGTVKAQLALADYYLAIGKVDASLELLKSVSATREGFAAGQIRSAMIAYGSRRQAEAHAILKDVLAKEPHNASALAVEGRLLLQEHNLDQATALVNRALAADARDAQAHVTLGYIYLARKDDESARKAFSEALNTDPTRVDAQVELAKIHYDRRELDTSIDYAQAGLKTDPNSLEAHLALLRTLTVRPDDLPRAQQELQKLLRQYPRSAEVHALAGVYDLAVKDAAAARREFTTALQFEPNNVDALGGLTALDFDLHKPFDARARLEDHLAKTSHPSSALLILATKVYAATGENAKAEALLKKMVEQEPGNLEAVNILGQFYIATHQLDSARSEYGEIVRKEPKSVTAQTVLGLLSQAAGDQKSARAAYEAAIRANPRAVAASNNLAWMYATQGGSLESALQLAQAAHAQVPDSAEVADTLAFVYYKKEMPGFAVPLLEDCVSRAPHNALFQLHLGLVRAQQGEDARARTALTTALKLNPRVEGADEGRRALAKLVY